MQIFKIFILLTHFLFLVCCVSDSNQKDSEDNNTSTQSDTVDKNKDSSSAKSIQCEGLISELTIEQCTSEDVSWLLQADTKDAYVRITAHQVIWLSGVWNGGG